jgi:hypothetical protein
MMGDVVNLQEWRARRFFRQLLGKDKPPLPLSPAPSTQPLVGDEVENLSFVFPYCTLKVARVKNKEGSTPSYRIRLLNTSGTECYRTYSAEGVDGLLDTIHQIRQSFETIWGEICKEKQKAENPQEPENA